MESPAWKIKAREKLKDGKSFSAERSQVNKAFSVKSAKGIVEAIKPFEVPDRETLCPNGYRLQTFEQLLTLPSRVDVKFYRVVPWKAMLVHDPRQYSPSQLPRIRST